jgi:hypothetical protein
VSVTRDFTVANIRDRSGPAVDVTFLESARIYRLPRHHPAFSRALELLRDAGKTARSVKVTLSSLDSDVIEDVGPG